MLIFKSNTKGITLVEVMVGVSLVAVIGVFVGVTVAQFSQTRADILDSAKKAYLAEEGYEILKFLRDEDWNNIDSLTFGVEHYLDVSTTSVAVSGTPEVIDGQFNRNFSLQKVYRDSSDDIVASTTSGATVDDRVKKIFINVGDNNSTTTYEALLANLPRS